MRGTGSQHVVLPEKYRILFAEFPVQMAVQIILRLHVLMMTGVQLLNLKYLLLLLLLNREAVLFAILESQMLVAGMPLQKMPMLPMSIGSAL